jgi:hypothetical protein
MYKKIALLAALLCAIGPQVRADEARAYKEGPVSVISFIKIKPGQFDNYMKYLDATYKPLMEQLIKNKIILGYKVYQGQAHNPHDADVVLSVTYANMAALDNLNDRTDPILEGLVGDRAKRNQKAADREALREVLGSEYIRELILK